MIRADELMLGDWLKYETFDKIVKVTALYGSMVNTNVVTPLFPDDLEPIPITPKILEKNGFELKADGWLWSTEGLEDQNYIFIQFRKGCEGVRNCEINFIHRAQFTFKQMYFVHELQHALKLCGIPKNIEL